MKKFIMFFVFFALCLFGFAQEADQLVEPSKGVLSGLDWTNILNVGLGIIAFVFATGWAFATKKIKQAGTLLIKFADAVEDRKVDANEKTDLAQAAKDLLSK